MFNCRSCNSHDLEIVLDLGNQPWGNDFIPIVLDVSAPTYPLQLLFCSECGMVQIGHTIPKETMFVDHNYVSGTTGSLRRHFELIGKKILEKVDFSSDEYILDVGGNDGSFLKFFKAKKIRVLNVDSGRQQAELSRQSEITCVNDFFNLDLARTIIKKYGQAKVIHGSGIFFHLEELQSAFDGLKILLQPGGVIVAEFIYLPEMVRSVAFDQIYHEHLLYYTATSFNRLLEQFDLTIEDAELAPIHGGTCVAYVRHKSVVVRTERLNQLLEDEARDGFNEINVYRMFSKKSAELRDKLKALIKKLKDEGLTIHALGAPVKGTTILHYCGLNENDIDCAVEINDLKVGTYYPGTRIPVYHQNNVDPPDVYLLLAWNFKDEIIEKLKDFRDRGGKIIVPIPVLEIL